MMKNRFKLIRRIAAWAGIIILLVLYLVTFILAVSGKADENLLMGCIITTVLVAVLIYAVILVARLLENRSSAGNHKADSSPLNDHADVSSQNPSDGQSSDKL